MKIQHRAASITAVIAASAVLSAGNVEPAVAQTPGTTTYSNHVGVGAVSYRYKNTPTGYLSGDFAVDTNNFSNVPLSSSQSVTYSFGDDTGTSLGLASDTITFSGSGYANALSYEHMQASISSTLSNAYFYENDWQNAPETAQGIQAPYYWIASAGTDVDIHHRFNGLTVAGNSYTMKWIWGIEGTENSNNGGRGFVRMAYSYPASATQHFESSSIAPQQWVTNPVQVVWGDFVHTYIGFSAEWHYDITDQGTRDQNNEGWIANSDVLNATVNYASSAHLQEIQVFDQNGNRFYDFTMEDSNGTILYRGNNAPAAAAPEPGTFALFGMGVILLPPALYRRRKSAKH